MAVADAVEARGALGLEALLEVETPRLLRLAYSILADAHAAEDAVQDTLVLAWRSWARLRNPEQAVAWLTRICVRRSIRCRRTLLRRRVHEAFEGVPGDVAAPQPRVGDRDVDWDRCFRALSPAQRAVVVLHYHHGHSLDECAELVGCRPGTVRTHLSRALAKLRLEIGDEQS